jgi:hypothetical protein
MRYKGVLPKLHLVPSKNAMRLIAFALLLTSAAATYAQTPDAKGIEFFEQKIRPVLVEHCYRCHSEDAAKNKKLKAGLFVDSRAGLLKGGEEGPSVVPGKPKEGLLMNALRHEKLQMPPANKLSAEIIADFEKWIAMGAPDPRDGAVKSAKREIDVEEGRKFWSFQPLAKTAPPTVMNSEWARTPIDRFILAKLEAKDLRPNAMASREKLLRRAYFDLIGLPPTPEERESFLNDASPDAYSKLIQRLLQSPQYGERWARHWLDVVRYAESGGYEFDGDRPGAFHYRDWVIRALNDDMPYDQFVRMQLAGDKLKPGDYDAIAATGFLVAGPFPGQITAKTEERIRYDHLDDMLSTIGSSMLGLTLGCVRCHEHKYDPIPQMDYYKLLAAIGKTTFTNVKVDPKPEIYRKAKEQYDREHADLQAVLDRFAKGQFPGQLQAWAKAEAKDSAPSWQIADLVSFAAKTPLERQTDGSVLAKGAAQANDTFTFVFHTHQKDVKHLRLEAIADASLPMKGPGLSKDGSFVLTSLAVNAAPLNPASKAKPASVKLKAVQATYEKQGNPLADAVDAAKKTGWSIAGKVGVSHAARFEFDSPVGFEGGTAFTVVLKFEGNNFAIGRPRLAFASAPAAIDAVAEMQNARELRMLLEASKGTLTDANRFEALRWFRNLNPELAKLHKAVEDHAKKTPQPALIDVFAAGPRNNDIHFLVRGEVDRKQGKVNPGIIQVLARTPAGESKWLGKSEAKVPPSIEPRIALADWMTDVEEGAGHLLARVIVNRVWKHHFGRGLVATPNDFGAQGERPSHPELLDWLASEFIRGGWKLKPLHSLIMTSAAYTQDTASDAERLKIDPENRLLWRRETRRLEAEAIRDALLHVGGTLDSKIGGTGSLDDKTPRRSIYLTVKRSRLIPFLQMFDAPEPIQSIGDRSTTTVPSQALAMMNSPFVRGQAEKLAARLKSPSPESAEATAAKAYRVVLSREPTPMELQRAKAFLEAASSTPQSRDAALAELCHVLVCLNEFIYVD